MLVSHHLDLDSHSQVDGVEVGAGVEGESDAAEVERGVVKAR